MTTIVATKDCMAADTMCSVNYTHFLVKKLHKFKYLGNMVIVGCAGDHAMSMRFVEWMKGESELVMEEKDGERHMQALVLFDSGKLLHYTSSNDYVPAEVLSDFFAIGSGDHAALGALYAGVDPRRAVKIASMVDTSTNDKIEIMRFDD